MKTYATVYGIDRGEPYMELNVDLDAAGRPIANSIMETLREDAVFALNTGEPEKALALLNLYCDIKEGLEKAQAARKDEAES